MLLRIVQFLAVILTALALVPGGAHLLELANKIELDQGQYFIVQSIYRGWALLGAVLFGALAANLVLAVMLRGNKPAFRLAALAFLGIAATLAIFFVWVYPTNVATANWTAQPENWRALRIQWEYGHAANAVITFISLCLSTLSVLTARR
jgi:hypothetical protein